MTLADSLPACELDRQAVAEQHALRCEWWAEQVLLHGHEAATELHRLRPAVWLGNLAAVMPEFLNAWAFGFAAGKVVFG